MLNGKSKGIILIVALGGILMACTELERVDSSQASRNRSTSNGDGH